MPISVRAEFGRVDYAPGSTLGPRVQVGLQLMVVESGRAAVTIDGRRRVIQPGRCGLLLPGAEEFFRFSRDEPTRHTWCLMLFDLAPSSAFWARRNLPWSIETTEVLTELIELGIGHHAAPSAATDPLSRSLGAAAFHAFESAARTLRGGGLPGQAPMAVPLAKACAYVAEHLAEPIRVESLAEAAGVTPNHLTRLFRQGLDTTPSRYLWSRRTEYGLTLLRSTGLSVSEVAYRCGFSTPFHFSRSIKSRFGESPRTLRRKWWTTEP
ncbi:MAG: AraC family transcriptional regulator [Planctomycetota bacterium]